PCADALVINEQMHLRGRRFMEVPELLRQRVPDHIPCDLAADEKEGIQKAWRWVKPGDRLVVITDITDHAIEGIRSLGEEKGGDAAGTNAMRQEAHEVR